MTDPFVLGAVAYAPKVVTIWEGFRDWLRSHQLPFDYVLYSNYETQVDDLIAGRIDIAWNSPLAWVRARRMAAASGRSASATVMRDTDQDLTSVVLVRSDAGIETIADLDGLVVGVGAIDSPQSRLIPLAHLSRLAPPPGEEPRRHTSSIDSAQRFDAQRSGVQRFDVRRFDVRRFDVRRFDVMVGKHGDHVGGEREAVTALLAGEVDAACIIGGNHLAFAQEGLITPDAVRMLTETPPYDHCVFTVIDDAVDTTTLRAFDELLLSMSFDDPEVRMLLELEGLREWRPGRTSGFAQLERAVDLLGLYDEAGQIVDGSYRP